MDIIEILEALRQKLAVCSNCIRKYQKTFQLRVRSAFNEEDNLGSSQKNSALFDKSLSIHKLLARGKKTPLTGRHLES